MNGFSTATKTATKRYIVFTLLCVLSSQTMASDALLGIDPDLDFVNADPERLAFSTVNVGCPVDNEWVSAIVINVFRRSRIELVTPAIGIKKDKIFAILNLWCKPVGEHHLYSVQIDAYRYIAGKNRIIGSHVNDIDLLIKSRLASSIRLLSEQFLDVYIASNFEIN